eukprot:1061088-Rhodomonas_salina.2
MVPGTRVPGTATLLQIPMHSGFEHAYPGTRVPYPGTRIPRVNTGYRYKTAEPFQSRQKAQTRQLCLR